ncbi:unnamed protein product [Lota lota]
MHIPPFGDQVAVAVEEALVGLLDRKMFGSGSKRWFVKRRKVQLQRQYRSGRRPCNRKRKRWAARILKQHRERILKELDVGSVLPYLVYNKVFSLAEYKEILGQASSKQRAEVFLEHLSSKGPAAFYSFCSVLEDVRPQLLTCFLLDGEDGDLRQGRKGGLLDPINKSRDPHSGGKSLRTPPMYTDPLFDSSDSSQMLCLLMTAAQRPDQPAICRPEQILQRSFEVAPVTASDPDDLGRPVNMGRNGVTPFAVLRGECFPCQSFSAGNGVVMLHKEDAVEADAKAE